MLREKIKIQLPLADSLFFDGANLRGVSQDGEVISSLNSACSALLICHAPYMKSRLGGLPDAPIFDVLELYAFVQPTIFTAPSPRGLAQALNINGDITDDILFKITAELLATPLPEAARKMLQGMTHWPWRKFLTDIPPSQSADVANFAVWRNLPETAPIALQKDTPTTPAVSVTADMARAHLASLLTRQKAGGKTRTQRVAQEDYAAQIASVFSAEKQHIVLAEAGTGVGKTLGYLAPTHAWLEQNKQQVWLSTYTRNLQRQIENELAFIYPNVEERRQKTVIRKGRENYLCLLNFQEQVGQSVLGLDTRGAITAGLLARWVMETRDGDLSGNDFPGWLPGLLGIDAGTMADKRGECIYAACDHYDTCFIERSRRKASRAQMVIANHAVVMLEAALTETRLTRPLAEHIIFDEGHHLFDAADSAFGVEISAQAMADLRRWLIGPEGGLARKRGRSLAKRLDGLLDDDTAAQQALQSVLKSARALPMQGALKRIQAGEPLNPLEGVFANWHDTLLQCASDPFYSVELAPEHWPISMHADFETLRQSCLALFLPMQTLTQSLRHLADKPDQDPTQSDRLTALADTLTRRTQNEVGSWLNYLTQRLDKNADTSTYIDWLELTKVDGRIANIALQRRMLNPMQAFGSVLSPQLKGMVVTSATLCDSPNTDEITKETWDDAENRCGANQFPHATKNHLRVPSPFNYAQQAKIIQITDVPKGNLAAVVAAYGQLFTASNGGALGLFTAISRLRQVRHHLNDTLPFSLFAQHVDQMDVGTLIDLFRADTDSCLLGTDAVRDGVDVPGRSLRLLVMDRVPWPRPTLLHQSRRAQSPDPRAYDLRHTRLRLKQAFGRLIRSEHDKGVFVMLDNSLPTSLHGAFPQGVVIEKLPLVDACAVIKGFVG